MLDTRKPIIRDTTSVTLAPYHDATSSVGKRFFDVTNPGGGELSHRTQVLGRPRLEKTHLLSGRVEGLDAA